MKKLHQYVPLHFTVSLILGIIIQFYTTIWQFGFQKLLILSFVFLIGLALFHRYKKRILFTLFSWLLFVLLGISSIYFQEKSNHTNFYQHAITNNSTTILTIDKVLKSDNYYDKYIANVSQINQQKTVGKILVAIQKDSLQKPLQIDTKLLLKPIFKELPIPLNPNQFNYKEYLKTQGVYEQITTKNQQFKILKPTTNSFIGIASNFRNNVKSSLQKHAFSADELGVINALLLGERKEISKELLQNYSKAGAIHILAVSGLHIGIILLILSILFHPLERLKNGKLIKTMVIVVLLWMFAFIAGLSASVVRAVTMFTAVAIGQTFNRKNVVEHSLVFSMFLLLLVKPLFLFDVGFQLSYLAVFGIVWLQPKLADLWKPKYKAVRFFWQLITVSLAAQVGILPLSLFYFHQFPGLFMLSNLVIIPFLGIILMGGFLVIFLSLLHILPTFLAETYGFIISLMNHFIYWISEQEQFLFSNISFSFLLMLSSYILLFFGAQFFIYRNAKRLLYFLTSVVLFQAVFIYEKQQTSTKNEFIIFHKSRKTMLGRRNGNTLQVFHNLDSTTINQQKTLLSYQTSENVSLSFQHTIPTILSFKNQQILLIDSLGVYKIDNLKNPILLLHNSPKINLNRLITIVQPTQIIADGSNYKSYLKNWKLICEKKKIPFYSTGKNGAFVFK